MHNPIEILKTKYKLPFDIIIDTETGERFTSVLQVMQEVGSWELTEEQYLTGIGELLGYTNQKVTPFTNMHMARTVYRYLIQNLVNDYKSNDVRNIDSVYLNAINQAQRYIDENPWVFTQDEAAEPKLDVNGNVQPKKGDKQVMAKKLWADGQKNDALFKDVDGVRTPIRKEWIKLLVDEVGMTPAGASTYFHNLKTGVY